MRFTTSEDVYPDKGMWHCGSGPGSPPQDRRKASRARSPDSLHLPPTPSLSCASRNPAPLPSLYSPPVQIHPNRANQLQRTKHNPPLFTLLLSPHLHFCTHTVSSVRPPPEWRHRLYASMHVMSHTDVCVCRAALNTYTGGLYVWADAKA